MEERKDRNIKSCSGWRTIGKVSKVCCKNHDKQLQKYYSQVKAQGSKVIENYKRYFLPEKYLESYLKIADRMSDASIENMVNSVFAGGELKAPVNKSRILFIHGTKANEVLSKKSARLMKKYYPETRIVCFKGSAHCYTMIYQPEQWIECVEKFLQE